MSYFANIHFISLMNVALKIKKSKHNNKICPNTVHGLTHKVCDKTECQHSGL